MKNTLDGRLSAAASFAREGMRSADIGTDHAYLPIYLAEKGISTFCLATDVNEGPIERAKENIELANLSSKIKTNIANGLEGIEDFMPDDIFICGMGGELICNILSSSEYVKNENVRLILQPMTSASELYIWLCLSGFSVICEKYALEGGKHYRIICAQYSGNTVFPKLSSAYFGKNNGSIEYRSYLEGRLFLLDKRITGLRSSGKNVSSLEDLKSEAAVLTEDNDL